MARINDIQIIRTRANGSWVIIKVLTDDDGLYGIGSASDFFNPDAIAPIVEERLKPALLGRSVDNIEDLWQTAHHTGYWRNGSLLNTALGGIDMALWDIKGKVAGLPLYQLLGGACRTAVPCYAHATGRSLTELEDDVRRYHEAGWPVIRCQLGHYGSGGFQSPARPLAVDGNKEVFDDDAYLTAIPDMFAHLREQLGFGLKLTHDVHSHLQPHNAVALAKRLEPYRLFFVEDILPPEQIDWYRHIRSQCVTPQAVGELFVNPQEWTPLITERLIDFVRVRVSKAGGISRALKIAHLAEFHGVQTAWQEGSDNDPVNLAAAMHLDMHLWNFGIQEENMFSDAEVATFPGCPEVKDGYLTPNDGPGLGIDIDKVAAAQLLAGPELKPYRPDRRPNGSVVRP